ncbi:MAG: hypothetical protein D3906_00700 [Candidatus Electrothrix sp. AUS1_2]|nr:hypothetical protein [Candidatus Electrothrix sp. AUS1_2]
MQLQGGVNCNGRCLNLGGKNTIQAEAGDCLRICTPGGGGWGNLWI